MAENTFQNSSEFKLKKCTISYGDGSNTTSLLSGDMIAAFSFHESIVKPFVAGSLMLSDSTGFLTNFPIQGGEIVEIEVSTPSSSASSSSLGSGSRPSETTTACGRPTFSGRSSRRTAQTRRSGCPLA